MVLIERFRRFTFCIDDKRVGAPAHGLDEPNASPNAQEEYKAPDNGEVCVVLARQTGLHRSERHSNFSSRKCFGGESLSIRTRTWSRQGIDDSQSTRSASVVPPAMGIFFPTETFR